MFINNKYTKWYNTIIKVAATRAIINEYHETHHIIPKSLGGSNDSDNLVKLTGREHYICHLLLTKMVQSKYNQMKMDHAAYGMIIMNKTLVTSRIYETLKIKHSNYMKTHNPMFNAETRKKVSESIKKLPARSGFSHSEETKRKMSESAKGRIPWNKGIEFKGAGMVGKFHSEETKRKISKSRQGQLLSETTKKQISNKLTGISRSKETRKKMSQAKKGIKHPTKKCEHCNKEITVAMYARWHGDKCQLNQSSR